MERWPAVPFVRFLSRVSLLKGFRMIGKCSLLLTWVKSKEIILRQFMRVRTILLLPWFFGRSLVTAFLPDCWAWLWFVKQPVPQKFAMKSFERRSNSSVHPSQLEVRRLVQPKGTHAEHFYVSRCRRRQKSKLGPPAMLPLGEISVRKEQLSWKSHSTSCCRAGLEEDKGVSI
jgi:hypothetical protein